MKSQFETIQDIFADETINWLKVDYFKRAKFDMAAWFRLQTGETKETGGIKKTHFLNGRNVGSSSPSLLLTMAKETGSRNEDGAYDYRSLILAALKVGGGVEQNISEIQISHNFIKGFSPLNLAGLPVFPEFTDAEIEKEWAKLFLELRTTEFVKGKLTNQMNNLKKKVDKQAIVEQEGYRFYFNAPIGTVDTIVDENGKRVSTIASEVPYLRLESTFDPETLGFPPIPKYGLDEIIKLYLEIEKLGKKIKALSVKIRPYELGILERHEGNRSNPFIVGGISVKISEGYEKGGYQHSEETAEKVKNGEYKLVQLPKSSGRWVCEPLIVGMVEMIETSQSVNAV